MGSTARFTAQIVSMVEPHTKDAFVKRAEQLGRSYAVLVRKAMEAYRASGALDTDDGKE
jgi:hypothetical protein